MSSTIRNDIMSLLKKPHGQLLCALLATDFAFFVLHMSHSLTGIPADGGVAISRARGYPETLQYFKFFWTGLLFAFLWLRRHRLSYLLFGAAFGYLLVDDANELHENFGIWFDRAYPNMSILSATPDHVGEAIALAVCGSLVLAALVIGYLRLPRDEKPLLKPVLWLLGCFAFFVFIVDAIHAPFYGYRWYTDRMFQFVEEGGEMITMSLILAYVLGVTTHLHNQTDDG